MNKRGIEERVILWAFYSFLAVFLLLVFINYIKEAATGVNLQKEFLARDLALTLDAAYASPMDISVIYNLKDNTILVKGNVIKVKGEFATLVEYSFANDTLSNIDGTYKDKIIIKKDNGKISIKEFKKWKKEVLF